MSQERLLQALATTAELMNSQLSPGALAMMAKDLSPYDPEKIYQALTNMRKTARFFNLPILIEEIEKLLPGRRIGADEAWALYPHNESDSAVITDEMAEAMGIAQPLLNEGDKIGARMAFKTAYDRIVENNKSNGVSPKWFASLGHDSDGRELVVKEAVRLGRLPASSIQTLLPAPVDQNFTKGVMLLKSTLQVEDKSTPEQIEKNKQRIAQIKQMLGGK
jgi:cytochrome c556